MGRVDVLKLFIGSFFSSPVTIPGTPPVNKNYTLTAIKLNFCDVEAFTNRW
jgi:hypothetical protein